MKTSELTDIALDWAVTKCLHSAAANDARFLEIFKHQRGTKQAHCYSISWAEGGPIIEREKIEWQWLPASDKAHQYGARKPSLGGLNRTFCMDGPTVLIAAMRCYVASQLGDEVDVPEELK